MKLREITLITYLRHYSTEASSKLHFHTMHPLHSLGMEVQC